MDAKALILLAFQIAIIGTVFGYGIQATREDLAYVVQRPKLLLRSFVAMLVIVPAVVVVCVKVLDLPKATEVVLTALAISPLPPLLPKKHKKSGGVPPYGLGLMLILALGATVTVPLSIVVLDHVFQQPLAMRPGAIVKIVLVMVVAPLAAGLLFSRLAPGLAHRLLDPVRRMATIFLVVGVLALLAGTWRVIWSATGHWTVIAIVAFVLLGLLVGHVMGGPEPEHASVLALSAASRHPAIALAVASTNYPSEHFAPTLILYLLLCTAIVLPYVKWQSQRASRTSDETN
jgi:BASS family bile acid:Na+ symporter